MRRFFLWFRRPEPAATIAAFPAQAQAMRYLALFLKIVLFVFLLGFAVKNSDVVTLHYFFGYEWQSPMALVILVAFAIGLMVGLLACSWRLLRSHRELRQLRRTISDQTKLD
jgi:uncharacterized integral membrane protein